MIAKVLVAIFLAVALMDQSSAGVILTKCITLYEAEETLSTTKDLMICLANSGEIFNELGEFDVKNVDTELTVFRVLGPAKFLEIINGLKACAAEATGNTKEEKIQSFRDCIDRTQ